MSNITVRNAREVRDQLRKELQTPEASREVDEALGNQPDETFDYGAPSSETETAPEVTGAGEPAAPEPPPSTPLQQEAGKGAEAPPAPPQEAESADKIAELEEKLAKSERAFKAIQRSITPTQQENARLKTEVANYKTEVERLTGLLTKVRNGESADRRDPEVLKKRIAEVKDVDPNTADVLTDMLQEVSDLRERLNHRDESGDQAVQEAEKLRAATVMNTIRSQVGADDLSRDPEFWNWIDAHGPEASAALRQQLHQPWLYEAQDTIHLFQAYENFKRLTVRAPAAPPNPPSAPTKTPSDIAPSTPSAPPMPNKPASTGPKPWSKADWDTRMEELRNQKTSPQRRRQIRDEMTAQTRLRPTG